MKTGFVKLFRKVREQSWYQDPVTPKIFMELLLTVNFTEGDWEGIPVYPGEAITSIRKLAENTGVTVQKARTGIKKLERANVLKATSEGNYTRIKLLKWADYQGKNQQTTNTEKPTHLTHEPTHEPTHPKPTQNGRKTPITANGNGQANTDTNTDTNRQLTHKRNVANNNIRREEEEEKNFFAIAEKKTLLYLDTVKQFGTAWGKYLAYLEERGKRFGSAMSENERFKELQEVAGNDPNKALECVNQAIAGDHLAFIPPKEGQTGSVSADSAAEKWEALKAKRPESHLQAALDRGTKLDKLYKEVIINKAIIKPDGRIVNG